MKTFKRWIIVLAVLAALGGLLELGMRVFMPSLIEGGARLALRVPQAQEVSVSTEGSMLLNALRWRISDVTVVAHGVPLQDEITATATLRIDSMPLFPAFGSLRNGSATFRIAEYQLDDMMRMASRGLVATGEVREGQLIGSGVVTHDQVEHPMGFEFEVPFDAVVVLDVEDGDILVDPQNISVQDQGAVSTLLAEALAQPRTVCIADRFPQGVTLTDLEVLETGETILHAKLSEGLLSNPEERFRGSCT